MLRHEIYVDILLQIQEGLNRIKRRFEHINSPDGFLSTDDGQTKLDGNCMLLIAVGESLKNLDKVTNQCLLEKYPQIDWIGAGDVIIHRCFDLDTAMIFSICQERIPGLSETVDSMISDLKCHIGH